MIDGDLAIQISKISAGLMLDYYSPNQDILKRVSSFDANEIDTIDAEDLSRFIIVLGQFLVFINYNENLAKIKSMDAERQFDRRVLSEVGKLKWKTGTTMKEKVFSVVSEVPELSEMENYKEMCKYEVQMYHGLYSTILEYMNAYKREQNRRQHILESRV